MMLCSDCSRLGYHTLQSAAREISMFAPLNAKAFVYVCDSKSVLMLYSIYVFLCVPYLAGINRGGRLVVEV